MLGGRRIFPRCCLQAATITLHVVIVFQHAQLLPLQTPAETIVSRCTLVMQYILARYDGFVSLTKPAIINMCNSEQNVTFHANLTSNLYFYSLARSALNC
eukprot:m.45334 g.45334  ORF g.45334 m.45334 type:complete len:100 (-) comp10231_c0_seq1:25-324(-)